MNPGTKKEYIKGPVLCAAKYSTQGSRKKSIVAPVIFISLMENGIEIKAVKQSRRSGGEKRTALKQKGLAYVLNAGRLLLQTGQARAIVQTPADKQRIGSVCYR